MVDDRKMICDRCRKAVPIADIQLMPKSSSSWTSLCVECRKTQGAQSAAGAKKKSVVSDVVKKVSYLCRRCNYPFKFAHTGDTRLLCPYCGKGDKIVEHKAVSADEIIKDSVSDY